MATRNGPCRDRYPSQSKKKAAGTRNFAMTLVGKNSLNKYGIGKKNIRSHSGTMGEANILDYSRERFTLDDGLSKRLSFRDAI